RPYFLPSTPAGPLPPRICSNNGVHWLGTPPLLALIAPSSGDVPNQCTPLLQQMRAGKAPAAVKAKK
ncbi:hypothetical protein EON09_08340, partial [Pseudomonas soli]|uniref:hypothetical protein n=1 Tax=Pseudomonas soli TaxID=1306993 RepID=UPI0013648885